MTSDSSITGGAEEGGDGGGDPCGDDDDDDSGAESADLSVGGDWSSGVESHMPLESLQKSNCKKSSATP